MALTGVVQATMQWTASLDSTPTVIPTPFYHVASLPVHSNGPAKNHSQTKFVFRIQLHFLTAFIDTCIAIERIKAVDSLLHGRARERFE